MPEMTSEEYDMFVAPLNDLNETQKEVWGKLFVQGKPIVNAEALLERQVLGAFMWWPSLMDEFVVEERFFGDALNREVFSKIADVLFEGGDGSPISLSVGESPKFVERVYDCFQDVFAAKGSFGYYLELLKKTWASRENVLQAQIILQDPNKASEALQVMADVASVTGGVDALNTVQEDFDAHLKVREDGVALISTGEPAIDKLLGGGWRAGMYGVAGRPKQGKSMVMLHFARKLAEQGRKVLFVSYEMDSHQVYDRLLASIVSVDSNLLAKNALDFEMSEGVWARDKVKHAKSLLPAGLIVVSPVDRDVADLYRLIQRTKNKLGGLDAVFVDYAQIMTLPKHKGTEAEMHAALSSRLQQMTMKLDLPVITGLQLRKPDGLNDKKAPGTNDIAGSDKYARDVVGILYIIRSHMEGDDPYGVGSEMLLKLGTSRFTPDGSARFVAEDKFSRIVHKEWR
jgi:replicative DNA helicase